MTLKSELFKKASEIAEIFEDNYDVKLNDRGLVKIASWITEYSLDEVETAIDIALMQYDDAVEAFSKLGGILYKRREARQKYFEGDE
jgi:hypothetical protein